MILIGIIFGSIVLLQAVFLIIAKIYLRKARGKTAKIIYKIGRGVRISLKVLFLPLVLLWWLFKWLFRLAAERMRATVAYYKPYLPTIFYFFKPFIICLIITIPLVLLTVSVFRWYSLGAKTLALSILRWFILAIAVISVAVLVKSTVDMLMPFYYIKKVDEYNVELLKVGRAVTLEGAPGTGKSFTLTYNVMHISQHSFREKVFEYILQSGRNNFDKKKVHFDSYDDYCRFQAVRRAVEFYIDNPKLIPMLASNYPVALGSKISGKFTKEHLLQQKCLPEGVSIAIDESADEMSNKRSMPSKLGLDSMAKALLAKENESIDSFTSKIRHFLDAYITTAEQDSGEQYKGFRRVLSLSRRLDMLEKVCEPARLIRRFDSIKDNVLKTFRITKRQYFKVIKLQKRINKIGFMKITHTDYDSDNKGKKVLGSGYYVLPKNLPFKYVSRAYFYDYSAVYRDIELEAFGSLYKAPRSKCE